MLHLQKTSCDAPQRRHYRICKSSGLHLGDMHLAHCETRITNALALVLKNGCNGCKAAAKSKRLDCAATATATTWASRKHYVPHRLELAARYGAAALTHRQPRRVLRAAHAAIAPLDRCASVRRQRPSGRRHLVGPCARWPHGCADQCARPAPATRRRAFARRIGQ